ncbi:MAG: ATP-binding cassette domain-containing protein [Lachnospiraceae bacterium]|nr:ATP-binding cassette domain-containing protein [Lachnospiraceae bacterium]
MNGFYARESVPVNQALSDVFIKLHITEHTLISEGSGNIFGGQKQRIMIVRAVLSKSKIIILDEATSALDNLAQKHVADALDKMGSTRIVIAHRLSTIRHCDRILKSESANDR